MKGKMAAQVAAIECEWRRANGPNPTMGVMLWEPDEPMQRIPIRGAEDIKRAQAQMQSDHERTAPSFDYWQQFQGWVSPIDFDEGQG